MKRLFFTFAAFLPALFYFTCQNQKKENTEEKMIQEAPRFLLKRGVNISHWLSQSEVRGTDRAAFFTRDDVVFIDSIGYDHIRIPKPIRQALLHDMLAYYRIHVEGFGQLKSLEVLEELFSN